MVLSVINVYANKHFMFVCYFTIIKVHTDTVMTLSFRTDKLR